MTDGAPPRDPFESDNQVVSFVVASPGVWEVHIGPDMRGHLIETHAYRKPAEFTFFARRASSRLGSSRLVKTWTDGLRLLMANETDAYA